jgi:type IV fimbrial biogenesis protein FimT
MNALIQKLSSSSSRLGAHCRRAAGFTLIELMIVIAVASILAGSAIPSMKSMLRSVRLSSATNDIMGALTLTRSEAIIHHGRAVMCKSQDGASCAPSGGWEQGWIIFHDADGDGIRDASEPIVTRQQALGPGVKVTGNQNVSRYISYSASGVTRLQGGGFQAGTLVVCNQSANPAEAREIVLSSSGRPRVQKVVVPTCG